MPLPKLSKTRYTNIRKDPQGRFWVDVTVRRKRTRVMCGELKTARDYLAKLQEEDRRAQLFPEEVLKKNSASLSLADLAEKFRDEQEQNIAEKSMLIYLNSDRHLQKYFGDQPIFSIEAHQCHAFRAERYSAGASVASVNRDLERLRLLLNLAERDRLISRSPLRGHKILITAPSRIRYLLGWEEEKLKAWCAEHDPELWRFILFAFLTGLRAREQWTLTWAQVKDDYLAVKRPKTSTRDHLPIRATVSRILDAQRGLHELWVFPNKSRRNHIDHDNLSTRRFKRAREGAGVKNLRWHDFRHTFCSRLISRGVDLYTVMALAGHSSMNTTRKYAHLAPDNLASSLDVLEPPTSPILETEPGNPQ